MYLLCSVNSIVERTTFEEKQKGISCTVSIGSEGVKVCNSKTKINDSTFVKALKY